MPKRAAKPKGGSKPTPNPENLPAIPEEAPIPNDDIATIDTSIDISKAVKLRFVNGLSYKEIAEAINAKKTTVYDALQPFNKMMASENYLTAFRENQVPILEKILSDLAVNIADSDKLKKASLNNVAYSFDRVFNALRLLKGEATSININANTYSQNLSDIEREIELIEQGDIITVTPIEEVEAEIAAVKDASTVPSDVPGALDDSDMETYKD
jgi:predicted DNA-binding protein YlxM (UPF0122 family)